MPAYSQRDEDRLIDRLLADLPPPPRRPVRTYIDPLGGFLRIEGNTPSPSQTTRLVQAMGGAMAKLASGDGACTEQDLQAMGFTRAEIETHHDAALRVARRMGGEA